MTFFSFFSTSFGLLGLFWSWTSGLKLARARDVGHQGDIHDGPKSDLVQLGEWERVFEYYFNGI